MARTDHNPASTNTQRLQVKLDGSVLVRIAIPLLSLAPVAVGAMPAREDKWLRAVTPHFVIVSNASEKTARSVGVALERFQAMVDERAVGDRTEAFVPTTIVAFADEKSFRPYKLKEDGTPEFYVGIFANSPDGNYIGMSLDSDEDPYGTIYHEYVHWMNSRRYLEIPLWLDEGMAEFYSTFRVDDNEVQIGRPVEWHDALLQIEPLQSFALLFDAQDSQMSSEIIGDRDEAERRSLFYAESWALYHYMTHGQPELRPKLNEFLESWTGSVNPNAAWKAAFGVDYEPMERRLEQYIKNRTYPYLSIKVRELPAFNVRIEPIDYAELLRCLGDYMAHVTPGQKQEALRHLQAAVANDSSNARARVDLACILAKMDRREIGRAHV